MKNALLIVDTLSDRRDLWHMLHRIHPFRRLAFLRWCCATASRPGNNCPAPTPEMVGLARAAARADEHDLRYTNMIYLDLAAIGQQYDFDLGKAMITLDRWIRVGGELPPVVMGDFAVKVK